eukprot:scaffold100959_cov29-Tisochrysis_lutea.AAC.1
MSIIGVGVGLGSLDDFARGAARSSAGRGFLVRFAARSFRIKRVGSAESSPSSPTSCVASETESSPPTPSSSFSCSFSISWLITTLALSLA